MISSAPQKSAKERSNGFKSVCGEKKELIAPLSLLEHEESSSETLKTNCSWPNTGSLCLIPRKKPGSAFFGFVLPLGEVYPFLLKKGVQKGKLRCDKPSRKKVTLPRVTIFSDIVRRKEFEIWRGEPDHFRM